MSASVSGCLKFVNGKSTIFGLKTLRCAHSKAGNITFLNIRPADVWHVIYSRTDHHIALGAIGNSTA